MAKYVYAWDSQNHWSDKKVVADDYKLQANETFDPVPDGQLEPSTRIAGGWSGATKEEHEAYEAEKRKLHPDWYPEQKPAKASAEQQMINLLGKQQMTQGTQIDANTADIKEVKQMINFIGKQQMAQGNK